MFKSISKELFELLEKNDLDPIYVATLVVIIVFFASDFTYYKKWRKTGFGMKFRVVMGTVIVLILIILSILRMMGILDY